jgi:hypothetical protein
MSKYDRSKNCLMQFSDVCATWDMSKIHNGRHFSNISSYIINNKVIYDHITYNLSTRYLQLSTKIHHRVMTVQHKFAIDLNSHLEFQNGRQRRIPSCWISLFKPVNVALSLLKVWNDSICAIYSIDHQVFEIWNLFILKWRPKFKMAAILAVSELPSSITNSKWLSMDKTLSWWLLVYILYT